MTDEHIRLRFVAPLRTKSLPAAFKGDIAFLPMDAIGDDGTYDHESIRAASEVAGSGYTYFEQGDVVRARVTPCFENGKGALLSELVGGRGLGTTELFVFKASRQIDARFLYYVVASSDFTTKGSATMYGAHGVRRVDNQFARDYRVWLPSPSHQLKIADYLDRETARIDAVASAKERQVKLLQEGLNSQLLWVVDPRNGSARRLPIRRILKKLSRTPNELGVVTAFRDGVVALRGSRRDEGFTESTARSDYQGVQRGDIVFHGLDGFAGAIGVSDDDGICTPVYHVCSALSGFAPSYVALALRGFALSGYLALQSGNVRERAVDFRNWEALARIRIPVPSLERQRAIAREVDSRQGWTEQMTGSLRKQLGLLHERRQALISAAVTGELDIPDAA